MNLRVDFPNNFVLDTATNCLVKLGSTVVSGTTCGFDLTTNEVCLLCKYLGGYQQHRHYQYVHDY